MSEFEDLNENSSLTFGYHRTKPGSHNRSKTHCIRGHLFDKKNTSLTKSSKGLRRVCRICHREDVAKATAARKLKQEREEFYRLKAIFEP